MIETPFIGLEEGQLFFPRHDQGTMWVAVKVETDNCKAKRITQRCSEGKIFLIENANEENYNPYGMVYPAS